MLRATVCLALKGLAVSCDITVFTLVVFTAAVLNSVLSPASLGVTQTLLLLGPFYSIMLNRQFKHYVYTLVWSLDDTLYLLLDNTVKVRGL